jgi:hypothetical protein
MVKTMPNQCPHTKQDNYGYLNCTKSDSTIGYCTTPCPYRKQLHLQLSKYSYISDYGVFEPQSAKELRIKLRYRIFAYSYILIEAVEGDSYEW